MPEICKKSLNACPVDGGLELFIIGKNFLKDTHVVFQETYESEPITNPADELSPVATSTAGGALWEQTVLPDKEYLQQVCVCVQTFIFIYLVPNSLPSPSQHRPI